MSYESSDHEHRYFIFKTYVGYDPITDEEYLGGKWGTVYKQQEYAILGCNCGSVIKMEVS